MEKQSSPSPRSTFIKANDLRLHVCDWSGTGERLLVLLHGLASSGHMFDLMAADFTSRFRVVAPDQRGHGLSDKPDTGYDFETIARDLDALLAILNPKGVPVSLVGHSWGAYTTLYYAATRPDRIARAVLLDDGINPLAERYPRWEEAQVGMAPPRYEGRSLDDIRHMIRADWLGPMYRPELEPLALSIFDTRNPDDVRAHLSYENHMQIAHALWAFDPQVFYPRVKCPVSIIVAVAPGQAISPASERHMREAESKLAQAEFHWMRDTFHDIPWHRPGELTALLSAFLK